MFAIRPDYDLDLMRSGQGLTEIMMGVLTGLKEALRECRLDLLLVHGDRANALAASLAAYYVHLAALDQALMESDLFVALVRRSKLVARLKGVQVEPWPILDFVSLFPAPGQA